MKKIVFLDGTSLLQKVYFSLPLSIHTKELHTNAVIGFIHLLKDQVKILKPDYITVIFGQSSIEDTMFHTYCAKADELPQALMQQTIYLQEVLKSMHIAYQIEEQKRTVDMMQALIVQAKQEKLSVQIVTADDVLLQFVEKEVVVSMPMLQQQKMVMETFDADKIRLQFGVDAGAFSAVKAIYAVAQGQTEQKVHLGQATAVSLMRQYQTLDNLFENIEEVSSPRIKSYLEKEEEAIRAYAKKIQPDLTTDLKILYQDIDNSLTIDQEAEKVFAKYELPGSHQTEVQNEPQRLVTNYKWSYHIEKIKNTEQAKQILQRCETGKTGIQILSIPAIEDTQMRSSESGQLYLQFEEKKENILSFALSIASEPDTVYWFSTEEKLSEEFLRQHLDEYAMTGKDVLATFDIKTEYKNLLSSHLEQFSLKEMQRMFDIKIAAYLINPLKSDYQIGDIAKEYLQLDMDSWQDLFGKADLESAYADHKEQVIDYYAKMAWVAQKTSNILEQQLNDTGMMKLYQEIEMPLTYVLFDMEQIGIAADPGALKQYGDKLQVRITELEKIIYEEAGIQFNINSPKQLGEVLFEKLSLPGGKKTKTGYSTAADVLEKLSEEYPIVNDILEYRQLTKLKSTYADGLASYIDKTGRIHTSFNQTITATGRLSSTEPNLQNIPMRMELGRLIRKVFLPKSNYVFMDADYSQIELRVLAHMSEDEKLISAYHMSEDIHRITASQVFHTPFEEVTDLQRRNAKAVNFGIVYGISSFGLSQGLSISRKEASEYIERYFETYPGVKTFMDKLVSEAKLSGYSASMFGRRRPIPELQASNYMQRQFGERVAMNAPIQGTAADIIKIAMVKVWEGLHEAKLKSKMILQIHDELLIETAPDEIEEVRKILSTQMQNAAQLAVPLEIDLHVGNDWYEAK